MGCLGCLGNAILSWGFVAFVVFIILCLISK